MDMTFLPILFKSFKATPRNIKEIKLKVKQKT